MINVFDIRNKNILLTGASGLFGRQISNCFLKCGANVILGVHNQDNIAYLQKELEQEYPKDKFLICHLELLDSLSIENCLKTALEKFPSIDILINNAALDAKMDKENKTELAEVRFEDYPIDYIRKSIDVNMIGTINITQYVCRQMLKQGNGNIINVASIYSLIAPNQYLYDFGDGKNYYKPIDYVVSKSFLPNFTRYIATLYAKFNIRCNAIAPHGVFNNHKKAFLNNFSKLSPMKRMCRKEELDGPFLFLASDASSYMTGETIVLDGGWSAW
jgi:NAD(P)-dependent dehydrogenase (short-subunit alcohol dehydrogenase family)